MNLAAAILLGVWTCIARNIVQISGCTDRLFAEEVPDCLSVMEGRESLQSRVLFYYTVYGLEGCVLCPLLNLLYLQRQGKKKVHKGLRHPI
jgi:hypothetical protein